MSFDTATNIDLDLSGLELQAPKKTFKQRLHDLMVKINKFGDRQVVSIHKPVKDEERF